MPGAPLQTIHASFRVLRRSPFLSLAIILTLAIGIGANTAIFSVVNAVLLLPLPFPEAERLVMVWMDNRQLGYEQYYVSLPDYRDVQKSDLFDIVAPHTFGIVNLAGQTPQALLCAFVAPELLTAAGARTAAGHLFDAGASKAGSDHVVILSHKLWQDTFGADPRVIGRTLDLNHEPYVVLGVAAARFEYPINFDISGTISPQEIALWIPLSLDREKIGTVDLSPRSMRALQILARLRPGVSVESARASLGSLGVHLAKQYPDSNQGWGITLKRLDRQMTATVRSGLWMLMGAVIAVLLMGCANVTNLLLAQAAGRDTEMAVRAALGAGRVRIIGQLLSESLLYSLAGAILGLLVAWAGIRFLWTFAPGTVPRLHESGLNGPVLLFTAAVMVFAAVLFGLWPAFLVSRQDLSQVLRAGSRSISKSRRVTRDGLIVLEFALASMLLITSGLMMKSFLRLLHVDPGFRPEQTVSVSYYLPTFSYPREEQRARFLKKLLAEVSSASGVESAGSVDWLPFSGDEARGGFEVEGQASHSAAEKPQANYRSASPDYFRTMRIPLRRGRVFSDRDDPGGKAVVLINETMARRYFAGVDPIGRRINLEDPPAKPVWREIAGVVGDIKHLALADAAFPDIYVPALQRAGDLFTVVVRSRMDAATVAKVVRRATLAVDPGQPIGTVAELTSLIATSVSKDRIYAFLITAFAAIAFLLALVGVCGVVLHSIAQRTREIGIRLAIGAEPRDVRRMLLWQSLRIAGAGILIGTGAGLTVNRLLASLLFEVSTRDSTILFSAPAALAILTLGAIYFSTYRATQIDAAVALREE